MHLHQYQLIRLKRTCEILADGCGCAVSEMAAACCTQQAAATYLLWLYLLLTKEEDILELLHDFMILLTEWKI